MFQCLTYNHHLYFLILPVIVPFSDKLFEGTLVNFLVSFFFLFLFFYLFIFSVEVQRTSTCHNSTSDPWFEQVSVQSLQNCYQRLYNGTFFFF